MQPRGLISTEVTFHPLVCSAAALGDWCTRSTWRQRLGIGRRRRRLLFFYAAFDITFLSNALGVKLYIRWLTDFGLFSDVDDSNDDKRLSFTVRFFWKIFDRSPVAAFACMESACYRPIYQTLLAHSSFILRSSRLDSVLLPSRRRVLIVTLQNRARADRAFLFDCVQLSRLICIIRYEFFTL